MLSDRRVLGFSKLILCPLPRSQAWWEHPLHCAKPLFPREEAREDEEVQRQPPRDELRG